MESAAGVIKPLATNTNHCDACFIIEKKTVGSAYMCRECRHKLCDECFTRHQKVVSTRNHTVLPLQQKEATEYQVSGRQAGSSDTYASLQVSDLILASTYTVSALQVSGRKPQFIETGSALQVSGRKTGYDSQSPASQVSGRMAGPMDTTDVVQKKGTQSKIKEHIKTQQSGTAVLEVDGRMQDEDQATGSDIVDQDQVTGSDNVDQDQATGSDSLDYDQAWNGSMKIMRLDTGTSKTQTVRQTGKPYTTKTLKHSLNVQRENDEDDCFITGLVALQDKLIVCDQYNSKLKVYDSSYTFLYEHTCDDKPDDIAMLDVNTVVVSSVSGCNMRLLSVGNDSMKEISKIDTEYGCEGVCCNKGKIYCVVRYYKDSELFSEVRVFTPEGQMLHKFEHLSYGKVECNGLQYITVNPKTGILYVTDHYKGVLALSTSGHVISVMSPRQLQGPLGITVDDYCHIYVCGYWSNNVIQMSYDGQNIVEILSGDDKCKGPWCIKIYGNKMFVSNRDPESGNYELSIYQLS